MFKKVMIYTKDIFIYEDEKRNLKTFTSCHNEALKCGLNCKCHMDQSFMELELWGSKWRFVKYYLKTLIKCDKNMDGFKRLIDIITT